MIYCNVQSGENCDLRPSAQATSDPLNTGPGAIILAVGTKYQDLTSNVVRTLMFNSTKVIHHVEMPMMFYLQEKRQMYQLTYDTLDYAISCLTPGQTFNEVTINTSKNMAEVQVRQTRHSGARENPFLC